MRMTAPTNGSSVKPGQANPTPALALKSAAQRANAAAQEIKLIASDRGSNESFGISVSQSGNRALIGAPGNADFRGSAYLFEFDGTNWVERAKLEPNDATADFGHAVALSGNRALVGARRDSENGALAGAAYVFEFDGSTWSQSAKLTASNGAESDRFGQSVSLSGDRALIGTSQATSVYVFDFDGSTWTESATLTTAEADTGFGWSVSLSGNRALIGNINEIINGQFVVGAAYLFEFDGAAWSESDRLTASDGRGFAGFGFSVTLQGDRAMVGAINGLNFSGSAYVFDFNGSGWTESAKLTVSDSGARGSFGFAVSLSGDRALIGARTDSQNADEAGSAYVFSFDGDHWTETLKVTASDAGTFDLLGNSVSLLGDRVLVGAPGANDENDRNTGGAYFYTVPPSSIFSDNFEDE